MRSKNTICLWFDRVEFSVMGIARLGLNGGPIFPQRFRFRSPPSRRRASLPASSLLDEL
jgi:hypothetical protein